jgi:hypothetical protein
MIRQQFQQNVLQLVDVNHSVVLQAKTYLVSLNDVVIDTNDALNRFIKLCGRPNPGTISFSDSPSQTQIEYTAQYISLGYAFCEAVWSLIHNGYIIGTMDQQPYSFTPEFRFEHVRHNGSSTDSVTFNGIFTPRLLIIMPSKRKKERSEFILFDPDLFVSGIGNNLHADVQSALEDAIRCFLQELYRPAVTLLGKAVEGAWVELGLALYEYAGSQINDLDRQTDKLKGSTNFMDRIHTVVKLYESRQDIYGVIARDSGVKTQLLKEISFWSDVVRDSRNAIHFGVNPIIPNTYEKVAVLLMSAASHLKTLYKLKEQADASSRA